VEEGEGDSLTALAGSSDSSDSDDDAKKEDKSGIKIMKIRECKIKIC
jgi:hypothetical protein